MDKITQLIKNEIKKQYKNVRQFSKKSGIPYSTLSNALSKGIGGTSYETVVKICNMLNLKQIYNEDMALFKKEYYEIYSMLDAFDQDALNSLKSILNAEYERCSKCEKIHGKQKVMSITQNNLVCEEAAV